MGHRLRYNRGTQRERHPRKKKEREQFQQLVSGAADDYFKKSGKRKPREKHYTRKKPQVIVADTSDWEAFMALFKPCVTG